MIRDRKMYVAPTPFALLAGAVGTQTLILPDTFPTDNRFERVGKLTRTECSELVIGYTFDLLENTLVADRVPNPSANKLHRFTAYRLKGQGGKPVSMIAESTEIGSEKNKK